MKNRKNILTAVKNPMIVVYGYIWRNAQAKGLRRWKKIHRILCVNQLQTADND
jgi:hypothetical protein